MLNIDNKTQTSLIRENILNNVSKELKEELLKDKWFNEDGLAGLGVFSEGIDDNNNLLDGAFYARLEKYFLDKGRSFYSITCKFSACYLRQYFINEKIKEWGFNYGTDLKTVVENQEDARRGFKIDYTSFLANRNK